MSVGQQIDQFLLQKQLGDGGMGAVYQARDVQLQRPVALKVMHADITQNPEFRNRFFQETRTIAALDHPNIIRIYAFQVDQRGQHYLVMEYVEGGSLRTYLNWLHDQRKIADAGEILFLMSQVAHALAYAHQQGILHRDLKPDNVLLKPTTGIDTQRFTGLLTDFGLAKLLDAQSLAKTQLNRPLTTLAYMAPEQFQGQFDPRSDLYAVGIMMYEAIVGRLPFMPRKLHEAATMHGTQPPPPPRQFNPGISPQLEGFLLHALEKAPERRFQSGGELVQAIQHILASGQIASANPAQQGRVADYLGLGGGAAGSTPVRGEFKTQITGGEPSGSGASPANTGPAEDTILVEKDGITQSFPVRSNVIMIGRRETHQIPLPGDKISRDHVRIERRNDGTYMITDLGSAHGTFLEDAKLLKNVPQAWPPDQKLIVVDYRLTLQKAGVGAVIPTAPQAQVRPKDINKTQTSGDAPAAVPAAVRPSASPSSPPVPQRPKGPLVSIVDDVGSVSSSGPDTAKHHLATNVNLPPAESVTPGFGMNVRMLPTSIEVEPGMHANAEVEIVNSSKIVKHCHIKTQGLPPDWVTEPRASLKLLPDDNGSLPLVFHPPRQSMSRAGRHQFQLFILDEEERVIGQGDGLLIVKPYYKFTTDMSPKVIRKSGLLEFSVVNEGNDFDSYTIAGRDREERLRFIPDTESVTIPPGTEQIFEFEVRPRSRTLIGQTVSYQFEMPAVAKSGLTQTQNGELRSPPIIPIWLLPLLIFLCAACLLLFLLFPRDKPEERAEVPATTIAPTADNSSLLDYLTATAQDYINIVIPAEQATAAALANSDNDDDGLTFSEEIDLETDPDVADSDDDGLSDGDEVNEHNTDPNDDDSDDDGLKDGEEIDEHDTDPNEEDTDGDGLTDGDEVNVHRTDPTDEDSDGDTFEDGVEIEQLGTDPNTFDRELPPVTPPS